MHVEVTFGLLCTLCTSLVTELFVSFLILLTFVPVRFLHMILFTYLRIRFMVVKGGGGPEGFPNVTKYIQYKKHPTRPRRWGYTRRRRHNPTPPTD